MEEDKGLIHFLLMKTNTGTGKSSEPFPQLVASITVDTSMSLTARFKGAPLKILKSLPQDRTISGFVQLCNVLKEISRLASTVTVKEPDYLTIAKDCLSEYLEISMTKEEEAADTALPDRVRFQREQLSLSMKPPKQRRYSADLLKLSYLMHACSSQVFF